MFKMTYNSHDTCTFLFEIQICGFLSLDRAPSLRRLVTHEKHLGIERETIAHSVQTQIGARHDKSWKSRDKQQSGPRWENKHVTQMWNTPLPPWCGTNLAVQRENNVPTLGIKQIAHMVVS